MSKKLTWNYLAVLTLLVILLLSAIFGLFSQTATILLTLAALFALFWLWRRHSLAMVSPAELATESI